MNASMATDWWRETNSIIAKMANCLGKGLGANFQKVKDSIRVGHFRVVLRLFFTASLGAHADNTMYMGS